MTDNETQRAKAIGRSAGVQRGSQAGDCPYPFGNLRLRRAWLEGFSEGRLRQPHERSGGAMVPDGEPRRVTYPTDLVCPRCRATGAALMSEMVSPRSGNVEFRIEAIPSGFHSTGQSRSLGETTIVCDACGVPAR